MTDLIEFKYLKRKAQFEVASAMHRHGEHQIAERMFDQLAGDDMHVSRSDCIAVTPDELETVVQIIDKEFEEINGPRRPYHQYEKFLDEAKPKLQRIRSSVSNQ